MTIIEAIRDPALFRPFLGADQRTWRHWIAALKAVYGLPIVNPAARDLVRRCTGRDPANLPAAGFQTALFLIGRRSGKSRAAAIIGAYEAALAGHERKLAKGERGVVAIMAPSRPQARVVRDYIRGVFDAPILANEIARETADGFDLTSGTRIEIMAGHYRTIRGYTLVAAIVDEAAFFGLDEEAKVRSDTELIRAVRPGLATVGGRLIAITSPYAKRGWTYQTFQRYHGNDAGLTLVWKCPSRTMNPTLPQSVVDEAMADDLAAARSEYLGEFREDVAAFVPREVIEAVVRRGRSDLLPRPGVRYYAFADLSGGRGDDAALAIAHRERRTVVIDLLRRYPAPHNPFAVAAEMAAEVRRFGLRRVTGDNYAAEYTAAAFRSARTVYRRAKKAKAELYAELLPRINAGQIELPDDPALIAQLAGLERRPRSGGRDVIDHPPGGHDDLANAAAGAAFLAAAPVLSVGPLPD